MKLDILQCKKQTTVAVIMKDGELIAIGTNEIHNPEVDECPREEAQMKTGEGYHLCKDECMQGAHAEVNACQEAGERAKGATLYLIGHTYCCDNCKKVMEEYGIKEVIIADK